MVRFFIWIMASKSVLFVIYCYVPLQTTTSQNKMWLSFWKCSLFFYNALNPKQKMKIVSNEPFVAFDTVPLQNCFLWVIVHFFARSIIFVINILNFISGAIFWQNFCMKKNLIHFEKNTKSNSLTFSIVFLPILFLFLPLIIPADWSSNFQAVYNDVDHFL